MNRKRKLFIILLRVGLGWFFLYQGVVAMLDPSWTILPLIQNARTFPSFYSSISSSSVIVSLSYVVKGAYILIGCFLILGLFVRIASLVGVLLMAFFYFPLLSFPHVFSGGNEYYIVDDHFIYAIIFLYLYSVRAGEYFGMGSMFKFSRY